MTDQTKTSERTAAPDGRRSTTAIGLVVAGVVLAAALVMVGVFAINSKPNTTTGSGKIHGHATTTSTPAPTSPPQSSAAVPHVPASVLDAVGLPSSVSPPTTLQSQPALRAGGLPAVVYIGAEYCPYCAAERWAMVVSLSRFGTFTKLGMTHSSLTDAYPGTPTFSFHGSTYTSSYLTFLPAELYGNTPESSGQYPLLDQATALASQAFDKYAFPPYTSSQGAFPFVDIGNRVTLIGASYTPQVLQGLSFDQIASRLGHATDPVAQAIDGAANYLAAAICAIDGGQPGSVCTAPVIRSAQRAMHLTTTG